MAEPIRLNVRTFEEMVADSDRLAPVITRLIALHVALWDSDDDSSWDRIPHEMVPGILDLMRREREFVVEVSGEICSQWGPESHLADLVSEWLSDTRKAMANGDVNLGYVTSTEEGARLNPITLDEFRSMALKSAPAMADREFNGYGTADGHSWLEHMKAQLVALGTHRLTADELEAVTAEAVEVFNAKLAKLEAEGSA